MPRHELNIHCRAPCWDIAEVFTRYQHNQLLILLTWVGKNVPCLQSLYFLATRAEHKGAEKQPGTRSCPTCAKTRPRPEAAAWPCSGPIVVLCSTLPSSPSPGPAQQKQNQTKPSRNGPSQKARQRRIRAAPRSRASPGQGVLGSSVCALLSICASPPGSVGGLGRGMGVCLSQGSFSPRDFFLAFLHSLLQASGKKKKGFGARATVLFNSRVKHLCTSGVLLLVWS